jgi:hypothetical protein
MQVALEESIPAMFKNLCAGVERDVPNFFMCPISKNFLKTLDPLNLREIKSENFIDAAFLSSYLDHAVL